MEMKYLSSERFVHCAKAPVERNAFDQNVTSLLWGDHLPTAQVRRKAGFGNVVCTRLGI